MDWVLFTCLLFLSIKSYISNGQKVAMRRGSEVYYLGGDHLGSTSLTTDSSGGIISEVRYLPYGQVRWSNGTSVTDFGFTSQRNEASFGLMDYNARYYSPVLGRFVSPDTIVPDPSSSGGFNRYRYTRNNPLKYTDPSGHCGGIGGGVNRALPQVTPCYASGPANPPIDVGGGPSVGPVEVLLLLALFAVMTTDVVDTVEDAAPKVDPFPNPQPKPTLTPVPPLFPTPENDESGIIYQFGNPGSDVFKNGPEEGKDYDGVSVALASKCDSPSNCYKAMFNGQSPRPTDFYRETTNDKLMEAGFTITPNGGDTDHSGKEYPFPHASVNHPNQNSRTDGTPKWGRGTKRAFKNSFSDPKPIEPWHTN